MTSPDSTEGMRMETEGVVEKEINDKARHFLEIALAGPGGISIVRDGITSVRESIEGTEISKEVAEVYKTWTMEDYHKLVGKITELFREKITS
jgi:hypothetical protein